MNIKEGFGRLALGLGIVGAIAGFRNDWSHVQHQLWNYQELEHFEEVVAESATLKVLADMPPEVLKSKWSKGEWPFSSNEYWRRNLDVTFRSDVPLIEKLSFDMEKGVVTVVELKDGERVRNFRGVKLTEPIEIYQRQAWLATLGFVACWSAIRLLGWIYAGFVVNGNP